MQLRFGLQYLHALGVVLRGEVLQVRTRFGELVLLGQHERIARMGQNVLVALFHRQIPFGGFVVALAFLIDLPKVEAHRVRILVVHLQYALELNLGKIEVVHLHRKQRQP